MRSPVEVIADLTTTHARPMRPRIEEASAEDYAIGLSTAEEPALSADQASKKEED